MTQENISLKAIRGFHIGGARQSVTGFPETAVVRVPGDKPRSLSMNGDHMVGQMYVTHYQQAAPRSKLPVLLWHGGGLSGASWEDRPDGGPGWLDYFLRAHYDVLVSDAFERGRSGWPAYPQVLPDAPEHRSLDSIWHHFRFGPEGGYPGNDIEKLAVANAHEGQQFPVEHLEQFGRQFVPRWVATQQQALAAYEALLRRVGPCVVIGHSQGAAYALECARRFPELIEAVVAVEPPNAPNATNAPATSPDSSAARALPPHLFIWGDFIDERAPNWQEYRAQVERYHLALHEAGTRSEFLDLPRIGIHGNSHLLIMDRNNQDIAKLVEQRLQAMVNN